MASDLIPFDLQEAFRLGTLERPMIVDSRLIKGGDVRDIVMPSFELCSTYVEHARFVNCRLLNSRFHKSFLTACTFTDCLFERFRFFELEAKECWFERVQFVECDIEELAGFDSSFKDVNFESCRIGPNAFLECTFEGLSVHDIEITGRAGYAYFLRRPDERTIAAMEKLGVSVDIGVQTP